MPVVLSRTLLHAGQEEHTISRIFENSAFRDNFEEHPSTAYLFGDSGYPFLPYLLTPLLQPYNAAQRCYNRAHVKTHSRIE